MTDDHALRQALAYARRGWPVFPCQPGQKIPATRHGYHDATTDQEQITGWFARHPGRNLAVATGAPGPDVLDVDQHGPAGNGFAALGRLRRRAARRRRRLRPHPQRRPARLLHRHRPAQRPPARAPPGLPLRRRLRPGPALPGRRPALPAHQDHRPPRHAWTGTRVTRLLQPRRQHQRPEPRPAPDRDLGHLARWVAGQQQGNRNAGLFWAANRALETDPAADLSPLAAAARQAGLGDQEITRTLDSARRTGQARPEPPDHQAEAVS